MKWIPAVLLFLLTSIPAFSAVPLIRVLGETGDHVVTSREVELDIIVERVTYDRSQKGQFDAHLERVLMEWAVFKEAESFGVSDVDNREIRQTVDQFLKNVAKSKYASRWQQLEVKRQEIHKVIERKLRARRFIDFKVAASFVPVTDAEALSYYQKNRKEFGKASFAKVRGRVKELIRRERAQTRLQDWYKVLERKYDIKRAAR